MKMRDMAMIGLGMLGTLAIEKYGIPMTKKASKAVNKKMAKIDKQI